MNKFTAKDFNNIFRGYVQLFNKYGFSEDSVRSYISNNNLRIQVILDKWGWNEISGSKFVIRVTDLSEFKGEGKYRFYTNTYDVSLEYLLRHKVVTKTELMQYKKMYLKNNELEDETYWIPFYDEAGIKFILDNWLERILIVIKDKL